MWVFFFYFTIAYREYLQTSADSNLSDGSSYEKALIPKDK